jgi:hypothetical protein
MAVGGSRTYHPRQLSALPNGVARTQRAFIDDTTDKGNMVFLTFEA